MTRVLISTLYSSDPVLVSITKLSPDRVILLVDKKPDVNQEKSLDLIKSTLGKVIDIKVVKTSVYDMYEIAKKCVEVIDLIPKDDEIFVNITSGRKTKAISLLFACYARIDTIKKIVYFTEEDNSMISLPKLSFKLSKSQKLILEYLEEGEFSSISDLAKKIDLSTAMLYRAIDELKDMDLVSTEKGLELTAAGRIVRL